MSSMISIDADPHRSLPDQAKLKISSRYSPGLKFRIPGDEPQFRASRTTDGNLVLIGQLTSLNERRDGDWQISPTETLSSVVPSKGFASNVAGRAVLLRSSGASG